MNTDTGSAILRATGETLARGSVRVDRRNKNVVIAETVNGTKYVVKTRTGFLGRMGDRRGIEYLASCGVPVASIVAEWGDGSEESPYCLILSYVEGEPLSSYSSIAAQEDVGRALRRIHSSSPDSFNEPHAWRGRLRSWMIGDLEWWRQMKRGTQEKETRILAYLDSVWDLLGTEPDRPILLDGRPEHLLVQGDKLTGVIDPEELWVGDWVNDLAVIAIDAPETVEAILSGYEATPAERERVDLLLPLYLLQRRLSGARWLDDHGYGIEATKFLDDVDRASFP